MTITTQSLAPPTLFGDRRKGRRRLRIAGWTMVWLGVLLFGFVGFQLWGTGLYTAASQDRLGEELSTRLEAVAVSVPSPDSGSPGSVAGLSGLVTTSTAPTLIPEAPVGEGEALGWIRIPTAAVDHVIVSGVSRDVLKQGPGHMPWTPLPGQPGNAVISGHRTTYGAPFFDLDRVEVGDEITVETLIGSHTYTVREILVVEPTDVWVTDPRPGAWLTLTTCTPRYSAAQRLVIAAELTSGPNLTAIAAASPPPVGVR